MEAKTTSTQVNQNPNWWRATFACALVGLLAMFLFELPFVTTFFSLMLIYTLHVMQTEMGSGVTTLWDWIWKSRKVVAGVVVFLTLRLIAGKILDLYPIDSLIDVKNSGGFWKGILVGRGTTWMFLLELALALFIGQITVMWVNESRKWPVRLSIVSCVTMLILCRMFPNFTDTWPKAEVVGNNMKEIGVVGTMAKAGWRFAFGKIWFGKDSTPSPSTPAGSPAPPATVQLVKVLVPMYDGFTPCSVSIDYKFELDTQGDPIDLKFPGIANPVKYSGKGTIVVSNSRDIGDVKITSEDPNQKVRVRIWKVKWL